MLIKIWNAKEKITQGTGPNKCRPGAAPTVIAWRPCDPGGRAIM